MDQNQSFIIGRLGADPILKSYTKSDGTEGTRVFFPVLTTRRMDRGQKDRTKRRVNSIPVVAWGEAAKRHAQFLAKGTEVNVVGELISEGVRQPDGSYKNYFHVSAADVQYGRRSMKNASPADIQAQINSLTARLAEAQAQAAAEPVADPATSAPPAGASDVPAETSEPTNPFDEGASA